MTDQATPKSKPDTGKLIELTGHALKPNFHTFGGNSSQINALDF
jgi:hypothetical protein